MKQSHLALISGLILLVILAFSWCGRQPKPGIGSTQSPVPTPGANDVSNCFGKTGRHAQRVSVCIRGDGASHRYSGAGSEPFCKSSASDPQSGARRDSN